MTGLERSATWHDIIAQPAIWRDWAEANDTHAMRAWMAELALDEVGFCGAGSSDCNGDLIVAALEELPSQRPQTLPTTDLVVYSYDYLTDRNVPIRNLGRTGNIAQTNGTVVALDAPAPHAPHRNISCNSGNALATPTSARQRRIVLPPAPHDIGLAVISGQATMLPVALAVFGPLYNLRSIAADPPSLLPMFTAAATFARTPGPVVFVGSGPLALASWKAALNVMERSSGAFHALWNRILGFRHRPKSVLRGAMDFFMFGSAHPHAVRREAGVVAGPRAQLPSSTITFIGPGGAIDSPTEGGAVVLPIVLVQNLAVLWSDRADATMDDPFTGHGTLSHIVYGVPPYLVPV